MGIDFMSRTLTGNETKNQGPILMFGTLSYWDLKKYLSIISFLIIVN